MSRGTQREREIPPRARVYSALKSVPARSDNWTAKLCSCSPPLVASVRAELERAGEIPRLPRLLTANGRVVDDPDVGAEHRDSVARRRECGGL